ncbi:MAG: GxxExxY protein [Bacteroidetes bacterium]|nr:GxxExxY protein [Bacteroidota bacterium]
MKKPIVRRDDLLYPELSYEIVGCAYEVFKELGFGHSEKIYQQAMAILFREKKCNFREQVYYGIRFKNVLLKKKFLDFEVERKIIVELKKNFHFSKAHIDQILSYLKSSKLKLAILINFGREGVTFRRIVNVYD